MSNNNYLRTFGNVVAYAKNFYEHRDNAQWMDMIHCIQADGWFVWSKQSVAAWCLNRMDELKEDKDFPCGNMLKFSQLLGKMEEYQNYYGAEDQCEAIMLYYINIIFHTDGSYFTDTLLPSEKVLPLRFLGSSFVLGKYTPSEMHSDYIERCKKVLGNYTIQNNIGDRSFDMIEGGIRNKSYKDVLVRTGSDNLNDCKEYIMTGSEIMCGTYDSLPLDINIYEHCDDIKTDEKYIVRMQKLSHKILGYTDIEYKIRSIAEMKK